MARSGAYAESRNDARSTRASVLESWTEFGLNPQRTDATNARTGISAANLRSLRRIHVPLSGTIDSSPIYLHDVSVDGSQRDVIIVTSTYGKTIAIDPGSGRILWTFTPSGYSSWAGSAQITTASPIADPDRRFVYAASPNGLVHKLLLSNGSEVHEGSWPVRVALDPSEAAGAF